MRIFRLFRPLSTPGVRRAVLASIASLSLLLGCDRAIDEPNVLLVVIDTLRRDRLGVYGAELPTSPALDELASRSLVFEEAVSTGDNTVLTHTALFTGLYPRLDQRQPGEELTLAEAFEEAGFATYGVAANPLLARTGSWSRGFDAYVDQPVPEEVLKKMDEGTDHAAKVSIRSADHVVDRALELLEAHARRDAEEPWFLFLNLLDPHDPYNGGGQWAERFRGSPSSFDGVLRAGPSNSLFRWITTVSPQLTSDDVRRIRELYDAEVRFTDSQLARLFDYLEDSGWDQETMILVTSDHGELLGERGLFTHGLGSYDRELEVPLILHVPWIEHREQRVAGAIESVDVAPTLLELAGLEPPTGLAGRAMISRQGRLARDDRRFTLHFHRPSSPELLERLGFAARSSHSHVSIRSSLFQVLLLDNGEFEIERRPFRADADPQSGKLRVEELAALLKGGTDVATKPEGSEPDIEEALRALGYIE